MLLPITAVDGVDWTNGKIRATGIGRPPQNAPTVSVGRKLSKRAALADAQRNMLMAIERVLQNADPTVKTVLGDTRKTEKIQSFLKGYTVASERELEGGKIEIVLALPLNGPSGLSRYINANID